MKEKNKEKKGFFRRLKAGLSKTRKSIGRLFSSYDAIDDDFYEELEETMIMGDMGVRTTEEVIEELQEAVKEHHIHEPSECRDLLVGIIRDKMMVHESDYPFENEKTILLLIGVNGTGKTTSAGKLAAILKEQGKKVMMAAADTFRAAAVDQLEEWSKRAGVPLIKGNEGADPASVVFDAVTSTKARGIDVLICDTAGRLHNKKNLMDELGKIYRIINREAADYRVETLLVLDGTTGQNALIQAREFSEAAKIDGIILTKLDGTAKGGIAVAIQSEMQVPVKYIGIGEKIEDLQKFDPEAYAEALFAGIDEADETDGAEEETEEEE